MHTPLYKILLFLGVSLLVFFSALYQILEHESARVGTIQEELSKSSNTAFARLTEYHAIKKFSGLYHSYTYKVPGDTGRLYEITEVVDNELNRKLRVGDTVVVKRKSVKIFGKETVISLINGNRKLFRPFELLIQITLGGIYFSLLLTGAGVLTWFRESPPYSQKYQRS